MTRGPSLCESCRHLREVASGNISPAEAVKAYHAALAKEDITPIREFAKDNEVTEAVLKPEQSK